jgi:hypothetical protein
VLHIFCFPTRLFTHGSFKESLVRQFSNPPRYKSSTSRAESHSNRNGYGSDAHPATRETAFYERCFFFKLAHAAASTISNLHDPYPGLIIKLCLDDKYTDKSNSTTAAARQQQQFDDNSNSAVSNIPNSSTDYQTLLGSLFSYSAPTQPEVPLEVSVESMRQVSVDAFRTAAPSLR